MASTLLSRRDLEFLLYEWLDVESLTKRERFASHDRSSFDAILGVSEEIATELFAPHNKRNDAEEPTFDGERVRVHEEVAPAVRAFAEAGLISASMDEEIGGIQLPAVVSFAAMAWIQAANVGSSSYASLTVGNAELLLAHGSQEQIDTFVRPMVEGRFLGTMCLSEPQAGSSLSDVTTTAVDQGDGTWRLTGNKMWISAGDHDITENIVHLVLARTPGAPPGVKGISLFVVPKFLVESDGTLGERNDVALAGLNHKMGYRGTTNCLLNFGEGRWAPGGRPGAVGYLVGEQHRGLAYMFHMMNGARVGVGLGATSLGYTGYLKSLAYAKTRLQGRPIAAKDPSAPPVPLICHADIKRMLLAQKSYVEGALALNLYCGRLIDEQATTESDTDRERARLLLELLTPIAKSWPSQWCLEANSLAIQIHGGYGYTREYDVEQHYRDNRLNAIHEGTHGIQALDLLGRKVVMEGGAALLALGVAIAETVAAARASGEAELGGWADRIDEVFGRIVSVTQKLWGTGDVELALANATAYLEAVGHAVIAWIWLEQALASAGRDGAFYDGKRAAARYFYAYELRRTDMGLDLLDTLDRTTLDMDDRWF